MNDCQRIDALVTLYVDGNIGPAERDFVDAHLKTCKLCCGRVHAEQAVRALLHVRRAGLETVCAPLGLRTACTAFRAQRVPPVSARSAWRSRAMPMALAAGLVIVLSGAFLYALTERSATVMAAELTADHVKCFRFLSGGHPEPAAVESAMTATFNWPVRLPEHPEQAGLELVGARPCLYAQGRSAHLMYLHHGQPVSIFMLPRTSRADDRLEVFGHRASIWSVGNRTFVLIAREPADEVERMAAFVHAALQ
jgi:anti-sigma factor RsiW